MSYIGTQPEFDGAIIYQYRSTSFAAAANSAYVVNTTAGAVTCTLPPGANPGDQIWFADTGNWGTNNLTLNRNGLTIGGAASNLVLSFSNTSVQMVYSGTTWVG